MILSFICIPSNLYCYHIDYAFVNVVKVRNFPKRGIHSGVCPEIGRKMASLV